MSDAIIQFLIERPVLMYALIGLSTLLAIAAFGVIVRVIWKGGKVTTKWFTIEPPPLAKETQQELENRISQKVEEAKKEEAVQPGISYTPPPLHERAIQLHAARYDIQQRIMGKVLEHGGGWAGVSLASFETFLDLAETHNVLSNSLIKDIKDYLDYTSQTHLFVNNSGMYEQAQFLAASIILRLEHGDDESRYWRG